VCDSLAARPGRQEAVTVGSKNRVPYRKTDAMLYNESNLNHSVYSYLKKELLMNKLTGKQAGIIVMVLITAALHLAAAFDRVLFPDGPDPLFILNGLGYLGLLGAYILPIPFFQQRRVWVWRALFAFVIVTIVAWLIIWVGFYVIRDGTPFFSHDSIYGVPSKIVELILLALLWSDK
jgi:hypothetical protein